MKRTLTSNSFWLKLLTEDLPHENLLLFPRDTYDRALTDGNNDFWHCTLKTWKKLLKNVEDGITDRFRNLPERKHVIMSQVNQNFHEFSTEFQGWLKFHMTPEAFITFKISNNKLEYDFKEFEDVRELCGRKVHCI